MTFRHYLRLSFFMVVIASVAHGAEWESLTPGNSLEGWRPLSGDWRITEEGVIIARTPREVNGWLLYEKKELWDFEVTLEFRTPTPTNGGLQFRSHWLPRMPLQEGEMVENAPKQMYGYQANIETRKRSGTGILMEENGRGYLAEPALDALKTLKQRDWNTMRVCARGNVIEVYLHEVLACKIEDEAFIGGYIALQHYPFQTEDEFVEVEYRNIQVKDYGREGQWRPLFDGQSLAGWKSWGEEKWEVNDGAIWGSSGEKKSEGYLATEDVFKDFRIRGLFNIAGPGNYGLFYHSTIRLRDDGYPLISGLQAEVEPSYPGSTGWVYESYQRGWLVNPDLTTMQATALCPGTWNAIEVRCQGNMITTWVNGIRVLNHTDTDQRLFEGSFALQLHSGGAEGIGWKDLFVLQ